MQYRAERWIDVAGAKVRVIRRPPRPPETAEQRARRLGALYLAEEDAVLSGRVRREENDT